jgi:hypothetical protein
VVPELQRDAVDRLADVFDGPVDGNNPPSSDGVAVTDAVNPPEDTDPENDEGPL